MTPSLDRGPGILAGAGADDDDDDDACTSGPQTDATHQRTLSLYLPWTGLGVSVCRSGESEVLSFTCDGSEGSRFLVIQDSRLSFDHFALCHLKIFAVKGIKSSLVA